MSLTFSFSLFLLRFAASPYLLRELGKIIETRERERERAWSDQSSILRSSSKYISLNFKCRAEIWSFDVTPDLLQFRARGGPNWSQVMNKIGPTHFGNAASNE